MKSFSLADNALIAICFLVLIGTAVPVMAVELISGIQLREHVKLVLSSRGLESQPIISGNRKFPACLAPLQVKPMYGGYKTISLVCPDPNGFKIAVRTQINQLDEQKARADEVKNVKKDLYEYVVPIKSMQRGEIIGSEDVVVVQRQKHPGKGYFRNKDDVIGRKAKRAIGIDQVIKSKHLELAYAIEKGQSVIIETTNGLVTVLGAGTATDDGQLGDRIKVKNVSSGLLVEGIAVSEKKIRILSK